MGSSESGDISPSSRLSGRLSVLRFSPDELRSVLLLLGFSGSRLAPAPLFVLILDIFFRMFFLDLESFKTIL